MKQPILMKDGTAAEDEDFSFNYETMEDGSEKRHLDFVMDFTEYFPYYQNQELQMCIHLLLQGAQV